MNFVNKFLVGREIRGGMKALEKVETLLLLASDLFKAPAISFYSERLAKRLTWRPRWVMQDFEAIKKKDEKEK